MMLFAHLGRHHFQVHAERVDAGRAHALEPAVVVGRLALALHRQVDRRLDREGAVGAAPPRRGRRACGVPVVMTMCLTPSSSTAARATSASCCGRLVRDRAAGRERLADRAELARLAAALVADAGLQHGRGEHVGAVQRGDVRVGHAVECLQRVEARLLREGDRRDRDAAAPQRAGATRIGRLGDERRGPRATTVWTGTMIVCPSIVTALWSDGPAPPRRLGAPAARVKPAAARSDCSSVISWRRRRSTGSCSWRGLPGSEEGSVPASGGCIATTWAAGRSLIARLSSSGRA